MAHDLFYTTKSVV